jgi:hypothetical protein
MMRRRGGRGVIGVMATTAVVAGTAGAVGHHQQQKYAKQAQAQQAEAAEQQQVADLQAQVDAMQAPAPAPAAGGSPDMMAQLQQLESMQAAGLLTAEQFEAAKNKLLGV